MPLFQSAQECQSYFAGCLKTQAEPTNDQNTLNYWRLKYYSDVFFSLGNSSGQLIAYFVNIDSRPELLLTFFLFFFV